MPQLRRIANIALLASDIQAAIVEGFQPAGLALEMLKIIKLPIAWADQRAALGFSAAETRFSPLGPVEAVEPVSNGSRVGASYAFNFLSG